MGSSPTIYLYIIFIIKSYTEYKHKKEIKEIKKTIRLVACNILNNTVNLLRAKPEEENVNTPDCKSSNSTSRLALPTSLGDMERQNTGQWHQV